MRHAIYYAPSADTLFHDLGSRWVGRDALTGEACRQPDVAGIAVVTADPCRYGFHATLKPPFALRDTLNTEALLRAVAALAIGHKSFTVTLKVAVLNQLLARRRLSELTPSQDRHLAEWGYPYVFGDFRFHMTLTERLPPSDIERFRAAAEAHFAPVLTVPVAIDGLSLFTEVSRGAAFIATRQFPFARSADEDAA